MKTIEEIQEMLVLEIWNCWDAIKSLNSNPYYYNEMLGDTSFLLSGLLDSLLKLEDDWDFKRWIDDSLLMKVELSPNKISIWGVMIWGVENATDQWTDPFYFEIELGQTVPDFKDYTFLFWDLNKSGISYEIFKDNRNYWRPSDGRDWKYVINRKKQ